MDDRMKGEAAGIFFLWVCVVADSRAVTWATRWSARKIISLFLVCWGVCAVAAVWRALSGNLR